jgi:subtilisin family serine protease
MRACRSLALLFLLLFGAPVSRAHAQDTPPPKAAFEATPEAHPELLLVGWRGNTTPTARRLAHERIGAERVRAYRHVPIDVIRVRDASRRARIVASYRARKDVRFVEPNYRLRKSSVPNDPRFNELWGLLNTGQSGGTPGADINITNVWAALGTGSTNVVVAVIDTGIDYGHPDLADNMWVNPGEIAGNGIDDDSNGIVDDVYGARWTGGNGTPTSGNPMDGDGHGTHVAGTIGALGNNGVGVAGVNWRVRLMALKFLDDNGSGWTADAIAAIEYAIEKGAHLSNNSWGGGGYSQALKDAIDAAGAAGQLFVAAAGNGNRDNDATPTYPASYDSPNIIAVAASDRNDNKASFSSYGRAAVDIAAPGVATLSTTPGGNYGTKQGTSMAAPHVAGAAALLRALFPSATADTIKAWLLDGARRLPAWEARVLAGGRLNVGESARIASLPAYAQPVSGFSATSANLASNIVLVWTNPASAEFSHVLIARGSNTYPSTWSGGVLVYSGALESVTDEPLPTGARFRYTIWAIHTSGTNTHVSAPRYATARVGGEPDDYFTEWFSANDNDLAFKTLTLVPNASLNRYAAYTDPVTNFPTSPAGGAHLSLGDDDFASVTVGTGKTVKLYGTAYSNLFVGSNGYITFGSGDTDYTETLASHFNRPRISMLFDDLNPAAGGTVSWKQLGDRLAVTFQNVREYGASSENSFQVELFFDGKIRITWLALAVRDGLAGLSSGGGIPLNFTESDLSAYPPFDDLRIAPAGGYAAAGVEGGPFAPAHRVYGLTNSGATSLVWTASSPSNWVSIVPSAGALPAGETIAVTVSISGAANALPYGLYVSEVSFSNATSGIVQRRPVSLAVARAGYTALFYADGFLGENPVLPALQRSGYLVDSASSWTNFEALLTGGHYTMAVALAQIGAPAAGYAAISNQLAAGRRALLIDRSKNADFGSLFEATYTGPDNQTPVTILEPDLAAGVTNPLPLSNPGHSRFAWGLAPMGSAESLAAFSAGQSAVVWGNNGRSALVGFTADALSGETGVRFFENLLRLVENGGNSLVVAPSAPWSSEGYELGPFSPSSHVYTLSNIGAAPLDWTLIVPSNWVTFAATNGTLDAGESTAVTGVIDAAANDLPPGAYAQTLIFSNATAGGAIKRRVALNVRPLPGVLAVSDSIAPTNDLYMPFGERVVGQTAVESITIRNVDSQYDLRVDGIALLSAALSNFSSSAAAPARAAPRPGDAAGAPHHPELLIVGFASGADLAARDDLHARMGATRVHRYRRIAADVVSVGKASNLKAALAAYRADPAVAYADLNYEVRAWVIPNDPRFDELWGLRNTGQTGGTPGADIRATDAWALATGDTNTIVAVLDTGIDYTHPDLAENLWTNPGETPGNGIDDDGNGIVDDVYGARWTSGSGAPTSGNPMDGNSHGTHVAGTIAARGNNGIGVAGVNWRARLMALKFLSDAGSGFIADAVSALDYAIDQGAKLSNNSWGGGGYSQAMKDMIDAAGAAGHLFVTAAGNSASDNDLIPQYPATYNCPNIVSVASSDHDDARSSFSCFGRTTVHLAAPGSSILSTVPGGGYGMLSGTSMATPHVAGAAALLWSLHPTAPYALIKQALIEGVDILPEWTDRTVAGGRLNVARAIQLVNPHFRLDGAPALPAMVPPGGAVTFNVIFRPIEAGVHTGRLRIVSNDASSPTTEVALAGSAVNDALEITPAGGFVSEGPPGGPFAPDRMVYTLTNAGAASLNWSASVVSAWAQATPLSGALAPGATASVTASLHAAAYSLPLGTYTSALRIANNSTGITNVRPIRLTVALSLCEAVDACDLQWTTGGNANWVSQTNVTSDGVDAAASGAIGDFQESRIATTVEGPGAVYFYWSVSSEANWDFLTFHVNGNYRDGISGNVSWQLRRYEIPAGVHTLRWTYVKDGSLSVGADRGWLDRVQYRRYVYAMADDHAGNYGPGSNFVHEANGGRGFAPWAIYPGGTSVADLFDSAPYAGNINSANNRAFRFYGGTGLAYVDVFRPFASPLRSGDTFRATLAYNWNAGARGMNVLAFDDYELFNINFGPGDQLSFKWGNTATTNLSTYWSPTTILRVAATQLASNQLRVTLLRSDGYTTNFTSSGLPAPAAQVKFYNGGHAGNDTRYALFANHLSIVRSNAHDADGDGIPDWWESEYFGGPTNAHALAPAAEGSYTIAEAWLADLNPLDPNARYPRAGVEPGPADTISIAIDRTSTARVYSIQYTTNLVDTPPIWVPQPPEMTGTGGAVYFHAPPDDPSRVYRTLIRAP